LPDFLSNHTNLGKIYQLTTNYTKRPQIIPNGREIFQKVIKYTNIFHKKALQNFPKLRFWFKNKPSGNPAAGTLKMKITLDKKVSEVKKPGKTQTCMPSMCLQATEKMF
jgi:hypothetical protein